MGRAVLSKQLEFEAMSFSFSKSFVSAVSAVVLLMAVSPANAAERRSGPAKTSR